MKSDQSLLQSCRRGDARAWRELLDRYGRLVYSIPINFGLTATDADDVAQATFSALIQSLHVIEDEERLGAWLGTVARRQTWRLAERRKRETPKEHDQLDGLSTDDDARAKVERLEWVHQGLVRLDERCKSLLTALYFDEGERSYVEVADRFSMPVGSIGPTRARCLSKLREILESLHAP